MTKSSNSFRTAALAGALALVSLTGCDALTGGNQAAGSDAAAGADSGTDAAAGSDSAATDLDPILAAPQEGDVWAADLNHFSAEDFGSGGEAQEDAFGQLKVVAVTPEKVTVVTENAAWPNAEGARRELQDRATSITWDENERIDINRSELGQLMADGKILATRR